MTEKPVTTKKNVMTRDQYNHLTTRIDVVARRCARNYYEEDEPAAVRQARRVVHQWKARMQKECDTHNRRLAKAVTKAREELAFGQSPNAALKAVEALEAAFPKEPE